MKHRSQCLHLNQSLNQEVIKKDVWWRWHGFHIFFSAVQKHSDWALTKESLINLSWLLCSICQWGWLIMCWWHLSPLSLFSFHQCMMVFMVFLNIALGGRGPLYFGRRFVIKGGKLISAALWFCVFYSSQTCRKCWIICFCFDFLSSFSPLLSC